MQTEELLWEDVAVIAVAGARHVFRRFRKYVEFDDLVQEGLEYAWKRKRKVVEYLQREDEEERRRGWNACSLMVRRAQERYARKEKARIVGFEVGDEYFYREALVERLLQVHFTGDRDLAGQVLDPAEMGSKRSGRQANEGNNLAALLSDIGRAMATLDDRTVELLSLRFGSDLTLAEVGKLLDLSGSRVAVLEKRAIGQIIGFLGGPSPY